MDKEKAKERIIGLVEEFKNYSKEELDKKSEIQIQSEFIDELFKALGWDMRKDVEREARVLKGRADYILRIGNQNKLVIEAKKTSVRLSEEEGRQAVSYAYHKNIKFSVLTNFKQIRVYHALSNIKNIDKNLLMKDNKNFIIDVEDFINKFDLLWLLSKESFENEEINKLLKNVNKRLVKPIDVSILTDLLQYREWLSKDLKSKREHLTNEQIDEIVQLLIDRLIFMRSVEDRGLEEEDFLLKKVTDVQQGRTDKNLWALLLIQFKIFDKEYNSKLFFAGFLEKEGAFGDNVLIKVIRGLYYGTEDHQERYRFDDLPVDLLGNIYEQYLGVVLRGTEKRVKLDLISGKRKKMGIYYTPKYIVDYILDNTLVEYAKDKTLDEILDMKVVDPACGSGSFLLDAFEELKKIIEERLRKGEKSKSPQFSYFKNRLDLGQKSAILQRCIYGVDLDEKAVELTQLNLLLKILEEETRETKRRILPNIKDNIKNGNSLIDDSSFEKAFNWKAQFPEVFKNGGFDIVIGNPPYVNIFNILEPDRSYFKKEYETATNKSDLYAFFIEKIIKVLIKDRGIVGLIVSNTWTSIQSFENLRKIILQESKIETIVPLENGTFTDAMVVPIIITFKKSQNKEAISKNEISLFNFNQNRFNFLKKLPQDLFLKNSGHVFSFSVNLSQSSIFKRINKNSIQLGDLAKFSLGIKSADNDKFVSKTRKDTFSKKVIKGREIKRYSLNYGGDWISYKPKEMMKRRGAGPRKPEYFETDKKIVLQEISGDKIVATLDHKRYYALDTVNILYWLDEKVKMEFILGLLNSRLINFWYGSQFKGLHVKLNELRRIPVNLPTKIVED